MASGKKNYFRHSTSAFEDDKIQKCIQLLGYEGYAYYFILIELLAKQCENSFKNPITLHQQSLRIVWRKQEQSCKKVVKKLEESGLFVATFRESFIDFYIPNLQKYMGLYSNKIAPNTPNKRKEKERKEKESKEKSLDDDSAGRDIVLSGPKPDEFLKIWNDELVPLGCKAAPFFLSPKLAQNYFKVRKMLDQNSMSFFDYAKKIKACDFLINKKKGGLSIGFVLDEENCFKIISGQYEEKEMSDDEAVAEFHRLLTQGM
jgi:hypothetical protein